MGTVTLAFFAQFTASKAGVNSLSVSIDIDRITRADGTRSALKTGDSLNITIGRRGLYGYYLAGCDLDLYDYVATFITADTSVDLKEVPALWTYWIADIGDAAVASVTGAVGSVTGNVGGNVVGSVGSVTGAVGSVTSPVTAGTVSDKTGYALTAAYDAAKNAAAPGASMVAGSLASQAQTDVQSALTAQGYTTTRAGYLDRLDAAISSIAASVWGYGTRLLTAFGFNVTVGTNNDKMGYSLASAPPSASAISQQVWSEALPGAYATGSAGKLLSQAGAASDPLLNTVPGSYGTGTAGYALGRIGTGAITAVSPVSADGGTIHVTVGDDYKSSDATAFSWTLAKSSLPTGIQSASCSFTVVHGGGSLTVAGSVTNNTDSITLTLELTRAQTALFAAGVGSFHWTATMATSSYTHTIARNGIAVISAP